MRRVLPIFLLGVTVTLAVVFGVVLLTRDDGEVDTEVAATTTLGATSSSQATSTPVASTVVSSAPVTVPPTVVVTTPPAGRCAGRVAMVLPAGIELSGGPGNFDGPPEPESIMDADSGFVFESGGAWYVGFSLDDGYVVYAPLPTTPMRGFEPAATVWDFDGDDGLLVHIDRSAMSGAEVYAFYYLDADCGVDDAGTIEVERLEFLDWFGASHTQAFTCTADGVFETSAGQGSGSMWDVRDVFYEWTAPADPGFVFGFEDGFEVADGDAAITAAGEINC